MIRRVTISLVLAVLALEAILLLRLCAAVVEHPTHADFGRFHQAVGAEAAGGSLYDPTPATRRRPDDAEYLDVNPPHFHLLILPLSRLPEPAALSAWLTASGLALALALLIVVRTIGPGRWTAQQWLLSAALVFLFPAVLVNVWLGQAGFILALLVTAAWAAGRTGRWNSAGGCLGVAVALKPFLVPLLALLWIRRQRRALLVSLAAASTLVAVGVSVYGLQAYQDWVSVVRRIDWEVVPFNASLYGFLARGLRRAHGMSFIPPLESPFAMSVAWLAGSALILLASIRAARRAGADYDVTFSLLALAGVLASPLGWVYYLVGLVGPLLALAARRDRAPFWRRPLSLAAIVCLTWPPVALWLGHPRPWATLTIASAYFWGTLALWVALRREAVRT